MSRTGRASDFLVQFEIFLSFAHKIGEIQKLKNLAPGISKEHLA